MLMLSEAGMVFSAFEGPFFSGTVSSQESHSESTEDFGESTSSPRRNGSEGGFISAHEFLWLSS